VNLLDDLALWVRKIPTGGSFREAENVLLSMFHKAAAQLAASHPHF
jgi:hypothetical protein